MTLIACTRNYNVPFLTSDILMSSLQANENFHIPTNNFNVVPFLPKDNIYKPASLAQKMYIVAKNICVVFAGDELEIKKFLNDFRIWCNINAPVRHEHIHQFLSRYDLTNEFSKSACFIISIEHIGLHSISVRMFNIPKKMLDWKKKTREVWQYLENDLFELVYASGSGRDDFLNVIDQKIELTTQHPKGSIWHAIQTNLSLIAKTLALEKVTLNTLKKNYGGGFESTFYNGNEFEKISNVVYVVAYKQFEKDGEIDVPFPKVFLFCTYISDIFRIIAVEVNRARKDTVDDKIIITAEADSFECRCFDVEGLDSIPNNIALPMDFSFKTDKVAMGYSLIGPDDGNYNPCWFNQHPELTVTYVHQRSIQLILSREINESLRTSCKEYFARTYK
jgi:hypothetical protein